LLTQGYASYSLGFVEDDSLERAKLFYLRAREYGFKLLQTTSVFKDSIPQREQLFIDRLNRLKKNDVPAIFWTGFAWGGWINLSKDNPQAIFDLGKVKAMMNKVIELDEGFFFGSAHLFFGTLSGALPKILGGDPENARQHFERCLTLSSNKFILAYVYLARYYALTLLDEDLFDQYLQKVDEASLQILPENKLITAIAKEKARRLERKKTELF
jgi:TRAP transporter T-component